MAYFPRRCWEAFLAFCSVFLPQAYGVAVCPGEGRWEDQKCTHDRSYRVCAQLLESGESGPPGGKPLFWGWDDFWTVAGLDFWDITGMSAPSWEDEIRANNGDSWCVDMWAMAFMIRDLGCEDVHIRCDATDVSYALTAYELGPTAKIPSEVWEDAQTCLKDKCPDDVAKDSQFSSLEQEFAAAAKRVDPAWANDLSPSLTSAPATLPKPKWALADLWLSSAKGTEPQGKGWWQGTEPQGKGWWQGSPSDIKANPSARKGWWLGSLPGQDNQARWPGQFGRPMGWPGSRVGGYGQRIGSGGKIFAQTSAHLISIYTMVLIASTGSGVAFAVLCFRRATSTAGEEALLRS